MEIMTHIDKEEVKRACNHFWSRLQAVVVVDGGLNNCVLYVMISTIWVLIFIRIYLFFS